MVWALLGGWQTNIVYYYMKTVNPIKCSWDLLIKNDIDVHCIHWSTKRKYRFRNYMVGNFLSMAQEATFSLITFKEWIFNFHLNFIHVQILNPTSLTLLSLCLVVDVWTTMVCLHAGINQILIIATRLHSHFDSQLGQPLLLFHVKS